MPTFTVINEMPGAYLRAHKNEVTLDSKRSFEDPVKFRAGTFAPTGYYVIVSGDRLEGDDTNPRRLEKGYFGVRHDDDYPKEVEAPEFVVYLQDPNGIEDATMKLRLRITTNYLEVLGKRLALVPDTLGRIYSNNRRYVLNVQDDGNVVEYDTLKSTDESRWVPVRVLA